MPKISRRLKVGIEKHPTLGELIVLITPKDPDGSSAYFTEFDEKDRETGMGMRLTKETALKLSTALFKLARKKK
jgi:hypothetical protein